MFEKFTDTITNQKQVDQTTLEKLKDIIPRAFKDGEFCLSTFLQELNLENPSSERERERERESYGLHWVGKEQADALTKLELNHKTLKPNYKKSLNFEDSNNIIIEGDNLEVLQILKQNYSNSIDVIYIDPPYNTGNDSFVYNDNFKQTLEEYNESLEEVENNYNWHTNSKSSGRFHTNWLNMMYPRLKIAHRLLKDDGVIFISIDDNEQARLKLICDEIFGEQNFITNFMWIRNPGGKSDAKHIASTSEYILFYAKNKEKYIVNPIKQNIDIKKYFETDEYYWKKGPMLEKGGGAEFLFQRRNMGFVIYYNKETNDIITKHDYNQNNLNTNLTIDTEIYTFNKELLDNGYVPIIPRKLKNTYGRWRMGAEKFNELWKENKIIIDSKNNVYTKDIIHKNDLHKYAKPKNIIDFTTSSNGTIDLKELFNKSHFSFPKPIDLIKFLINLSTNSNALILDFFAGSGTTGQSAMELNNEDGGNRKYILVQINEQLEDQSEFQTISDITRERIKRSIEKYDYKEKGFKFFEVCPTHFKNLDRNEIDLNTNQQISFDDYINSIKPNTNLIDLIYEIIIKHQLHMDIKLCKETIFNHQVIMDETKTYLFLLESDNYDNVFDVIHHVWKDKNRDGSLKVILLENKLTDENKINLAQKMKNFRIDSQITIEVI